MCWALTRARRMALDKGRNASLITPQRPLWQTPAARDYSFMRTATTRLGKNFGQAHVAKRGSALEVSWCPASPDRRLGRGCDGGRARGSW
jgi:hypothetical protein